MTDKKRPSTRKMKDYENEKLEIANELGTNHVNDPQVNVKIAAKGEAEFSKKTRTKHNNLNNQMKTTPHEEV